MEPIEKVHEEVTIMANGELRKALGTLKKFEPEVVKEALMEIPGMEQLLTDINLNNTFNNNKQPTPKPTK